MPFTVITLTRVPPSLRGDLSKWMQEIATGVYVGNFNRRVREELWERVKENIGSGQATISYEKRNEIGYQFECFQTERQMIELEGIPLVIIPQKTKSINEISKANFSHASKFHQARKYSQSAHSKKKGYIVLDIETTGLDEKTDKIFEIGAIKIVDDDQYVFHKLIFVENIPSHIKELTGINQSEIKERGLPEKEVLESFLKFIGENILVGYNISFDFKFLNQALESNGLKRMNNRLIDIKRIVKKENPLINNYKLSTVLKKYKISEIVPHRALEDAQLIYDLILKLNKFDVYLNRG